MAWISTAVTSEVKLEMVHLCTPQSGTVHLGHFGGIQAACEQEEFVAHCSSRTDRDRGLLFFFLHDDTAASVPAKLTTV